MSENIAPQGCEILQTFVGWGSGVGGRSCFPPYNPLQALRSYIFVSLQQITPKLGIFTHSGKDFFPAVLNDFRWLLVVSKVEKTVEGFNYPVVLHAVLARQGLKLRGHVLKSFLSKGCTSRRDRTRACDLLYCLVWRVYVFIRKR